MHKSKHKICFFYKSLKLLFFFYNFLKSSFFQQGQKRNDVLSFLMAGSAFSVQNNNIHKIIKSGAFYLILTNFHAFHIYYVKNRCYIYIYNCLELLWIKNNRWMCYWKNIYFFMLRIVYKWYDEQLSDLKNIMNFHFWNRLKSIAIIESVYCI